MLHGTRRKPAKKNPRGQSKTRSSRTDPGRRGTIPKDPNELDKEELELKVKIMQEELRQKLWAQQTYNFKMDEGFEFKL